MDEALPEDDRDLFLPSFVIVEMIPSATSKSELNIIIADIIRRLTVNRLSASRTFRSVSELENHVWARAFPFQTFKLAPACIFRLLEVDNCSEA